MANVMFKRGASANLGSLAVKDGQFIITTDTHELFTDVGASRVKIGDFQTFASLDALPAATTVSTSALFYIEDANILAKSDGTKYVQINPDHGATSIEVTGDGAAQLVASYDDVTRKITLNIDTVFETPAGATEKISNKVGDIGEQTVKAYVEAKTTGIASDAALQALAGRMDTAETKLTTLQGEETVDGSVKHIAKGYADGKDAAIAAAKKAGDDAKAAADKAQETADAKVASVNATDASIAMGGTDKAPTVGVQLSKAAGNKIELDTDGLKVILPAAAEYSIVKEETSADYAAVYHLTKDGANVGAAINIPKDMVVKSGAVETNPAGQAKGTYLVLTLANATEDKVYINVGSLIEYVTSGSKTGDMIVVAVSDDHKVTATITDGTITKAKLHADVQTSLNKADSALQAADVPGYADILTKTSAAATYVAKESGKRLMAETEGAKLEGIEAGAQVNVLEAITSESLTVGAVTGKAQTIDLVWGEF